jgi:hypothetical protein
MRQYLFSPRVLLLGVLAATLGSAVPAQAAVGPFDTSECVEGTFAQPFAAQGDGNSYTLLAGQSEAEGFQGTGWELSGGAQVVTTTLPNGSTGQVLDLPSGAKAVSPRACVMTNYPTARAYVLALKGQAGVSFQVEYEGKHSWERPKTTGQLEGWPGSWTVAPQVKLKPGNNVEGWEPMRITLVGNGTQGEYQVYDLYLDPRLSH